MVVRLVSPNLYLAQTNYTEDLVNLKLGRSFLYDDARSILKVEARPDPQFKYCYHVYVESI